MTCFLHKTSLTLPQQTQPQFFGSYGTKTIVCIVIVIVIVVHIAVIVYIHYIISVISRRATKRSNFKTRISDSIIHTLKSLKVLLIILISLFLHFL